MFPGAARHFMARNGPAVFVGDLLDAEIAQRRRMEHELDFFPRGQGQEFGREIVVRRERDDFDRVKRRRKSGGYAAEAGDLVLGFAEALGEEGAQLAGGEIADAPHLVDGLVTRTGCDDDAHEFGITLRLKDV